MTKTDVLIIGGSAAGFVTAMTARSNYPDKSVMVIRKEKKTVVPCGIPYIFGSLESSEKNLMPDGKLQEMGVNVLVDVVTSVELDTKVCHTKGGDDISFDKIVFATGSIPKIPNWLEGKDLDNVFVIPKDKDYLDSISEQLHDNQNIVVVGGGFIGVEVSDELNKAGKHVTLVEVLPHILGMVFDEKMSERAQNALQARGVTVKTGHGIKAITGNEKVSGVVLDNGDTIEADAVILSMGYEPNTQLAKSAGLATNRYGQIDVDEYMRTDNYNVFAVGDCAQKRDFFTRRVTPTMLASTACAEARIVGMNLFSLYTTKNFKGTLSIFFTALGDDGFGAAGLTVAEAQKQQLPAFGSIFEGVDKHPGTLPNTHKQIVELVVAKGSGLILGGSVAGGPSTGELVNIISLAIQNNMTVYDLITTQIGTHPLLTAPPTAYPIIKAAEMAMKQLHK
jgi:NADH oxidase (H2O2-forming)